MCTTAATSNRAICLERKERNGGWLQTFNEDFKKYLVVIFLHEAAQSQAKAFIRPDAPVHGVNRPWRLVFINLFPLTVQGHVSTLIMRKQTTRTRK